MDIVYCIISHDVEENVTTGLKLHSDLFFLATTLLRYLLCELFLVVIS
jgi:hypothetical protein